MHVEKNKRQIRSDKDRQKRVFTLILLAILMMLTVALGVYVGANYHG